MRLFSIAEQQPADGQLVPSTMNIDRTGVTFTLRVTQHFWYSVLALSLSVNYRKSYSSAYL